jgi:hypothetical protein
VRKELFMKTLQSSLNLFLSLLTGGFIFAGCYTRMETIKDDGSGGIDNGDYAYADSSGAANDTTGNNYFADDDYRSSQYRTAFDYYSPSWYGDDDYPWDATLMYPYPYWDEDYPYYGWGWGFGIGYGYGYGRYYNGGYRGGHRGGIFAGRLRTIGSTRGGSGARETIPTGDRVGSSRTSAIPAVATSNTSRMGSRQEIPWWQRAKATTGNSQARSGVAVRPRPAGRNMSMKNEARNVRTPSSYRMSARWMNDWVRTQSAAVRGFGPQSRSSFRQQSPHSFSPQAVGGWTRSSSGGGGSRGGGGGSRGGGGGGRGR